jgi:hypothetical protein
MLHSLLLIWWRRYPVLYRYSIAYYDIERHVYAEFTIVLLMGFCVSTK